MKYYCNIFSNEKYFKTHFLSHPQTNTKNSVGRHKELVEQL